MVSYIGVLGLTRERRVPIPLTEYPKQVVPLELAKTATSQLVVEINYRWDLWLSEYVTWKLLTVVGIPQSFLGQIGLDPKGI